MIYMIITTSIYNKVGVKNYDHRKERYMNSIRSVLKVIENERDIKAIVVENNGYRSTYLDELGCDVVYTNSNDVDFGDYKGVNELLDIKQVMNQYKIKDEDMIIKITGRYKMVDKSFIEVVKSNIERYDAFLKFYNVCTHEYMRNDCVLGLYGLRCKYLRPFKYNCMRSNKSPECEFAEHVRGVVDEERIMEVKHLGLECCFADDLRLLYV